MKKTFFLFSFLIFCCCHIANAQEWFPIGAKWTYNVIYPDIWPSYYKGIETVYCKGDTVINGINTKILVGGNTICNLVISNENYFYYNEEQDILYMYWEDDFKPLIDFSKKEGETYYSYYWDFEEGLLSPHLITVDYVKIIELNGVQLRQQFFISSDQYGGIRSPITEFLVNFMAFYPENFETCDMELSDGLRCYESSNFNYYAKPEYEIYGCDYNVSINNENFQTEAISVFPNPVRNAVTIQIEEDGVHLPISFVLFDVLGNKITEGQIQHSYFSINISSTHKGIYFLKLMNKQINENYKLIKI